MNDTDKLTYSNPRTEVIITDWPSGAHKTTATFTIETNKDKQRAVRLTINPKTGKPNAPKKLTYAVQVIYVDGSDGRLYIMERSIYSSFISVMKGTFDYQQETIHQSSEPERFAAALALFQ
jgi:hypothetical protein